MIPHPPELDGALGRQVWEPRITATFLTPTGAPIPALTVVAPAGTYESDASRWPRQTVDLLLPTALTPDRTSSPVSPFGGGLLLDWSATYLGRTYAFRLATLDVVETVIDRPAGLIRVKAASHEARVDEDRYDTTGDSPGGTGTALITAIVRRTLGNGHPVRNLVPPAQDTAFPAAEFTYDSGAWQAVEQIADAIGAEAWFDAAGALVIRPVPVKAAAGVLTYRTGDAGSITRYESARGWAHNRVVVRYEDRTHARRVGIWEDTAPGSASRVSGPYGRHTDVRTYDVTAPLPSQATADAAAKAIARRSAALYRSVTLDTVPAPWIEPGDTVTVDLLGGSSERLLVAAHRFPLDALDVATVVGVDDTYTTDLGTRTGV